jgi:uncharacterized protein (TIGR00645 family)
MDNFLERTIERGLFASRWLMAPFYVGLALSLAVLMVCFLRELFGFIIQVGTIELNEAILGALSLIDLSLAGNLMLIVIFSGYENFVSKMDIGEHKDEPEWLGTVDFSGLKVKLVGSIIGIASIHMLKVYMGIDKVSEFHVKWMTLIYVIFLISGILLVYMDYIAVKTKKLK